MNKKEFDLLKAKLSSNFSFLLKKEYIKLITKSENNKENFFHLLKVLESIEESINLRHFKYIQTDIRWFYEIHCLLIDNLFPLFDEKYSSFWTNNKEDSYRRFNFGKFESYLSTSSTWNNVSKNFFKHLTELRTKANEGLHYSEINSFLQIRGTSKRTKLNLETSLEILKNIFELLIETFLIFKNSSIHNDDFINIRQQEFDKSIYEQSETMWKLHTGINSIIEFVNFNCKHCEEGKLIKPENEIYKFGPFLQCSNKNCEAILSLNLNLRFSPNVNIKKCDKCGNKVNYKINLNTSKQSIECKNTECSWKDETSKFKY